MEDLRSAVLKADGLSFAQLRKSYILAGQLAFDSGDTDVAIEHLRTGIEAVRGQTTALRCMNGSKVGFDIRVESGHTGNPSAVSNNSITCSILQRQPG